MKTLATLIALSTIISTSAFGASLGQVGSFSCTASYLNEYPAGVEIGSPKLEAGVIRRALKFKDTVYGDVCVQKGLEISCDAGSYTISMNLIRETNSYGNPMVDSKSQASVPSYQGQIEKDIVIPGFEHESRIYCSMKK